MSSRDVWASHTPRDSVYRSMHWKLDVLGNWTAEFASESKAMRKKMIEFQILSLNSKN